MDKSLVERRANNGGIIVCRDEPDAETVSAIGGRVTERLHGWEWRLPAFREAEAMAKAVAIVQADWPSTDQMRAIIASAPARAHIGFERVVFSVNGSIDLSGKVLAWWDTVEAPSGWRKAPAKRSHGRGEVTASFFKAVGR